MCIEKHNWDDQLSEKFVLRFTEIADDFNNIDRIIFNRKYCFTSIDDPIVNIQLHGFSDASLRAYGCCVYLRIEHKSGIVKCNLVSAKSRVSPIKKQSIPRLELLAVNLLANLFVCVYDSSKNVYSFDEIYFGLIQALRLVGSTMFLKFISSMFNLIFFFFFFLSGFSFMNIHDSQDSRGRGRLSL